MEHMSTEEVFSLCVETLQRTAISMRVFTKKLDTTHLQDKIDCFFVLSIPRQCFVSKDYGLWRAVIAS